MACVFMAYSHGLGTCMMVIAYVVNNAYSYGLGTCMTLDQCVDIDWETPLVLLAHVHTAASPMLMPGIPACQLMQHNKSFCCCCQATGATGQLPR